VFLLTKIGFSLWHSAGCAAVILLLLQSPLFLLLFLVSSFHGRPLSFRRGVLPIFLVFTSALETYGIQKTLFEALIERSSDGRIIRFVLQAVVSFAPSQ
jgi:hypothetical protein